jgi:lysozyme family protein
MADITQAIQITLKNEGGYVNNPLDSGGATNFGILQRDWPSVNIAAITAEQAASWYQTTTQPQRFNNPLYSQINSQAILNKLFDMGVLFGVGSAVMMLQQVLQVTADGGFGPATLAALNADDSDMTLSAYKSRLHQHEIGVGEAHPTDIVFEEGWGTRIDS